MNSEAGIQTHSLRPAAADRNALMRFGRSVGFTSRNAWKRSATGCYFAVLAALLTLSLRGAPLTARRVDELRSQIRANFFVPSPLPALNAKTHRQFSPAPGVQAEAVSYTTEYGTRVPAILYLPDPMPAGKIPAFIVVNGHGGDKYSWYSYYSGITYARAGAAVLTYDQAGEGERSGTRKSGTREHDRLKGGPIMARQLCGLMLTDIMQAVSYLSARPEVDPARIAAGGYSMGSFVLSIAGAIEPRLRAVILTGGGNLDGPNGYWDRSKDMCQGYPYQSLSFLGDRPAAIYALAAARGPTMIWNGSADTVVNMQHSPDAFFAALHARAQALTPPLLASNLFEWGFTPAASHRPQFLNRSCALWLNRLLHFPNWTDESIRALPEVVIGEWSKKTGFPIDKLYATPEREGGMVAIDTGVPGMDREYLSVFTPEEWRQEKASYLFATWTERAEAASKSAASSAKAAMRYRFATVNDNQWTDPRQEPAVAEEIDRIVGAGFNGISIGTYYFLPMYFVDFSKTKYPEAQEFDAGKVAANLATLRHNIQLAKSKGVKLFISRSYAHYAPYHFWKAHQRELNPNGIFTPILEHAHQNEMYLKSLQGKDHIVPQQQWTNPVFKQFFLDSTAMVLDAIPELDGFLNAYAEAAWTYDLEKLKTNDGNNWKEAVNYPATDDNFVDYSNHLYRLLKAKRGDRLFFGMRDWYVKPEVLSRLDMPRDELVISAKYAGYDQPLINYPPWGKTLLDRGYSVILDMLVFDAEHPHPLYWYDPDIIFPTFKNIEAAGFSGVMYQDFTTKGEDSTLNPIRLLTQRTVGAAIKHESFTRADAVKFLQPTYGAGSADLLDSLKQVSLAQSYLIKLCPAWFWQGDGLTPGGLQTLRFWMLMDNPDAPPGMAWVRQDTMSVKDFVADARKENSSQLKTPLAVIALMQRCADEAVAAVLRARSAAPRGAPYMKDMVASAVIHRELVQRDSAFIKAAIAFYASGGVYDDKYNTDKTLRLTETDRRAECVAELKEIVRRDEIIRKLTFEYAPRRRATRSKNDYAFEKKIAAICGQALAIPPVDEAELKACKALIE
jgi:dienelactone hydrolase